MADDRLPPTPLTWAYADAWAEEDPHLVTARRQAESLGAPTVARATGAALRSLAAATAAAWIVEIGSGTGVSGGWLLAGMAEDGVLTTVDPDPECQAAARDTFAAMGVPHTRVRTIAGDPADVLTRLADDAYDLVVVGPAGVAAGEQHALLAEVTRVLRPGGTLVLTHAMSDDGMSAAHRDLAQHLRDDPEWIAALLTVGDGMVVATLQEAV